MIRTSKQLKDKVKNISNGSSNVAQAMIRIFVMERFLESWNSWLEGLFYGLSKADMGLWR